MRAEALVRRSPAAFVLLTVIDLAHRLAGLYHALNMSVGDFAHADASATHQLNYLMVMQAIAGMISSFTWLAFAIVIEIMLAIHDRLQVTNA